MFEEMIVGSKKKHKRDLIIIICSYLLLMVVLPFLLSYFKVVNVYSTEEAWLIRGDVNLAFVILTIAEFFTALIVSLITHKQHVYTLMIMGSFFIKLILYFLISVVVFWMSFWTIDKFITEFEFLFIRIISAYYAFNGVFFSSILLCLPTLMGRELGNLIKNKHREKELLNGSKN